MSMETDTTYCLREDDMKRIVWESLHPSLVTVPVDWKYEIPYGVIYALDANAETRAFIGALS